MTGTMIVLSASALACRRGERLVFSGLDFSLAAGSALLVAGANGSGKSSLLRLLAGLLTPFAGAIAWNGEPVARDPHAHRRRVAYLGHADAVKASLSVGEDIRFWTALDGNRDTGDAALAAMGLASLVQLPCRHLSAGQKRRLALARVLARVHAPLWILDEPTNGLDAEARRRLARALAAHRDGGGLVVAASHEDLALPGAAVLDMGPFAVEARTADVRGLEVDQVV
jgi:heme exporter protein A